MLFGNPTEGESQDSVKEFESVSGYRRNVKANANKVECFLGGNKSSECKIGLNEERSERVQDFR